MTFNLTQLLFLADRETVYYNREVYGPVIIHF